MSQSPLAIGSVFARRYRVLRRLPGGGMGAVYEVEHTATERRCALKVMLPELVQSPGLRERFEHEARIAARVESEHIVSVFDAGVDEATAMPFLVMELLQGEELGDRLERLGPLGAEEVVLYLGQAATALDKTHAAGIIHRDLKPENLFLCARADGSPLIKILDFGIAKLIKDGAASLGRTATLGTPLYMAPEQFAGEVPTPATDVFALGLVSYTLLVGVGYWHEESSSADSAIAFALRAVNGPAESAVGRAARFGRALPAGFDAWFFRATHPEPSLRFQHAGEALEALGLALQSPPEAGPHRLGSDAAPAAMPGFRRTSSVPATLLLPTDAPPPHHTKARRWAVAGVAGGAALTAFSLTTGPWNWTPTGGGDGRRGGDTATEEGDNPDGPATTPIDGSASSVRPGSANGGGPTTVELAGSGGSRTQADELRATGGIASAPPSLPSSQSGGQAAVPHVTASRHPPPPSCFEHPHSGRIKPYTPGAPVPRRAAFPCVRRAAGSWERL